MICVKDLNKKIGKSIEFQGFVDNIRDTKWVTFVILRDNTGLVQMTVEKSDEKNKEILDILSTLTLESTVKVKCKVV